MKLVVALLKLLYNHRLLCDYSRLFGAYVCALFEPHILHSSFIIVVFLLTDQSLRRILFTGSIRPFSITTEHFRSWIAGLEPSTGGQVRKDSYSIVIRDQGVRSPWLAEAHGGAVMNHDLRCLSGLPASTLLSNALVACRLKIKRFQT